VLPFQSGGCGLPSEGRAIYIFRIEDPEDGGNSWFEASIRVSQIICSHTHKGMIFLFSVFHRVSRVMLHVQVRVVYAQDVQGHVTDRHYCVVHSINITSNKT